MIMLLWVLNFAISWFNAWSCGRTWEGTKNKGGGAHFMNWMGAIMSAAGFTWCYLLVIATIGSVIENTPDESEPIPTNPEMYVSPEMMQAVMDLGYLVIIFPILGSGLAITIQSWRHFARRHSLGNGAVAGWNSFAQVHNMYSAVQHVPDVYGRLSGFFAGGSSRSSSDNKKGTIVILLVALAVLGGIMTTFAIIKVTARNYRQQEFLKQKYEELDQAA